MHSASFTTPKIQSKENSIEFQVSLTNLLGKAAVVLRSPEVMIGKLKSFFLLTYPHDKYFKLELITEHGLELKDTYGAILVFDITIRTSDGVSLHSSQNKKWKLSEFHSSKEVARFDITKGGGLMEMLLHFKLMKCIPLNSCLIFCFSIPEYTPLFPFLNSERYSDCCFEVGPQKSLVWANKKMLIRESSFFEKMFENEWSESLTLFSKKAIPLPTWSTDTFLSCLLHIYTGWLPHLEISPQVNERLNMEGRTITINIEYLSELYSLAKMLQLDTLRFFTLLQIQEKIIEELSYFKIDSSF